MIACSIGPRPLVVWLLRGIIGALLLAVAFSSRELLIIAPAILLALVALNGCPMCWLFGLVGLVTRKFAPTRDAS